MTSSVVRMMESRGTAWLVAITPEEYISKLLKQSVEHFLQGISLYFFPYIKNHFYRGALALIVGIFRALKTSKRFVCFR